VTGKVFNDYRNAKEQWGERIDAEKANRTAAFRTDYDIGAGINDSVTPDGILQR